MTPLRNRLGKAIRKLRQDAGYSQEHFADRAHIHRTTMSEIERGLSNVSLDIAERIAKSLGITLTELIAEAEATRKS